MWTDALLRGHDPLTAHLVMHERDALIPREDYTLDCPICSGLPPWEWPRDGVWTLWTIRPLTVRLPWSDERIQQGERYRSRYDFHGKYLVSYTIRNQRNSRTWGAIHHMMATCRTCGKWARVARHRIESAIYPTTKDQSICLACARRETRSFLSMPLDQLISRLKGAKKGRLV